MTSNHNTRRKFNKGRWLVERERCRIGSWSQPTPSQEPTSLSNIIPSLLGQFGLEAQHWAGQLESCWGDIVGKAVARHSRPGRIEGHTLTVFVDSSVWLSELSRTGRKTMLRALRERFPDGKITDLRFSLDPDGPRR